MNSKPARYSELEHQAKRLRLSPRIERALLRWTRESIERTAEVLGSEPKPKHVLAELKRLHAALESALDRYEKLTPKARALLPIPREEIGADLLASMYRARAAMKARPKAGPTRTAARDLELELAVMLREKCDVKLTAYADAAWVRFIAEASALATGETPNRPRLTARLRSEVAARDRDLGRA